MSYVIQNFYNRNKHIAFTPRFKFLFFLYNIEKLFTFFKFNTFLYFINKSNTYNFDYFFLFLKVFFSKQYVKILYKMNLDLVGNYNNNLTKSAIYHTFNGVSTLLDNKFFHATLNFSFEEYLFNYYFCSLKTVNTRINNQCYKNIFFFFMLVFSFIWYQHSSFIKFYLNFIPITYHFQISRFYNGYFLKIYNF